MFHEAASACVSQRVLDGVRCPDLAPKNSFHDSFSMAFDKAKTLQAAAKFLELGKIPLAIKEYSQVVEGDTSDFTTLNILGDLHVRVGNPAAAILCFRRIAEHYREQDFGLKAIAMFKKIDRLKPNDVEIATSLAELYAQQDLIVEARSHYLVVANAHTKSGDTQAGLEVLRKIADLDPQNTDVRLKLAESYLKEGMTRDAVDSFTVAGQHLLARSAFDQALDVLGRALELDPADYEALNGLLAAHGALGTADDAVEAIQRAVDANPDDIRLVSMLARAHVWSEDPEQAEISTAALIAKDRSSYLSMIEVARLYLSVGRIDDSVRVISGISEQMLAEREEGRLLELINDLLTSDADNVPALNLLVQTHWWVRDVENLKAALERLAEAAQAAGRDQDERYALTQLTRLAPDETHHVDRLKELGGPDPAAAAEILPEVEAVAHIDADAVAIEGDEFEVEENKATNSETETSAVPARAKPSSFNEMEIERGSAFEVPVAEQPAVAQSPSTEESIALDSEAGGDADRNASLRAQELESVDFYISQGYMDIAVDTLDLLENQFGKHSDIDTRRQQIEASRNGVSAEIVAEPETVSAAEEVDSFAQFEFHADMPPAPDMSIPVETAEFEFSEQAAETVIEAPVTPAQIIDPGLAEIFEEYRISAEGESNGNGDYETHYNLGLAYQEMDLFEEALEEFQVAISLVRPEDGTPRYLQCCNLIGHCFLQKGVPQLAVTWFKKGLSAPSASEDERQALRFDLAAAYEQAGDLNQAMNLFTEVYGINVSYRGVNERLRALQSRLST